VVWRADPDDCPAAPSAWWEVAGSMAGQADPSQLESERELCPNTTGDSSELNLNELGDFQEKKPFLTLFLASY
jgi:hypothetical protein